jgi:hypothetical protein
MELYSNYMASWPRRPNKSLSETSHNPIRNHKLRSHYTKFAQFRRYM